METLAIGRTIEQRETEFKNEVAVCEQKVLALRITNDDEYELSAVELRNETAKRKQIMEFFDPMKKATDAAHKAVTRRYAETVGPLEKTIKARSAEMGRYQMELENKRKAEQLRIQREEQKRIDEAALARAVEIEKTEGPKAAEAVLDNVPTAPPIRIPSAAPKVAGTMVREEWKFEIEDTAKIPREYMVPNESMIRSYVNSNKERAVGAIPGVKVWCEKKVHGR